MTRTAPLKTSPVPDVLPNGVTEECFAGYRCLRLSNGAASVWVTLDVGPRLIGFATDGPDGPGPNVFADDLRTVLPRPGGGVYSLRGGHRLWLAPENPYETYRPDDAPVEVEYTEASRDAAIGVRVGAPRHPTTGVQRSIHVSLPGARAGATVAHHVTNGGRHPVRLAPWAITQLPPGGTAVVPLAFQRADLHGVLPNSCLVTWPYTRLDDPRITLGSHYALVRCAADAAGACKIGTGGVGPGDGPGWLAYARPGVPVFVKRATRSSSAVYPDGGCSSEVYSGAEFCELETLGPLVMLAPGATAVHVERWTLHAPAGVPETDDEAHTLAVRLGLTAPDPSAP